MHRILLLLVTCGAFVSVRSLGQTFQNGDLEGIITGYSSLPDLWTNVPDTDPVCEASNPAAASPDLTSTTDPSPGNGVAGTAYSGDTYVSGVNGESTGGNYFHEGIQQEVSGLAPGLQYIISFWQCVDARFLCEDTSGYWAVYADGTFVGYSEVSISHVPLADLALEWEERQVAFTATASTHTLKFLPTDDDGAHQANGDPGGALSMGIDLIQISPVHVGMTDVSPALPMHWDPAHGRLVVQDASLFGRTWQVVDTHGRAVAAGRVEYGGIQLPHLPSGAFVFVCMGERKSFRFVNDR